MSIEYPRKRLDDAHYIGNKKFGGKETLYDGLKLLPHERHSGDYELLKSPNKKHDEGTTESRTITFAQLSNSRRLAAFAIPNVEPPITSEEIERLAQPTPTDELVRKLVADGTLTYAQMARRPEFVAVVESKRRFSASLPKPDLTRIMAEPIEFFAASGDEVQVGIGRTALFEVTPLHGQEVQIRERIDALAATRQPVIG